MTLNTGRDRLTKILKDVSRESSPSFQITYKSSERWLPKKDARIVVLDSSFNPPTRAHLQLTLESLKLKPSFDACLLLFATNNADKSLSGASLEQRVEMMHILATQLQETEQNYGSRNVAVGVVNRGLFSEKVSALQAAFLNFSNRFYFITGFDTVIRIFNQKYYQVPVIEALTPIFDAGGIVCANRSGFDQDTVKEFFASETVKHFDKFIYHIELNEEVSDMSSTKARLLVQQKAPQIALEKLIIPEIAEYLNKEQLYNK